MNPKTYGVLNEERLNAKGKLVAIRQEMRDAAVQQTYDAIIQELESSGEINPRDLIRELRELARNMENIYK